MTFCPSWTSMVLERYSFSLNTSAYNMYERIKRPAAVHTVQFGNNHQPNLQFKPAVTNDIMNSSPLNATTVFCSLSFTYWQGWLLMGVLFVPMLIAGIFMSVKNPGLLRKRMNAKEKESEQKTVVALSGLLFIISSEPPVQACRNE